MKKYPLTCIVLICLLFQSINGQTNITTNAPLANYYSQTMLPGGMTNQSYERGCFLITQNELTALISNSITSIGFSLEHGTGSIPVSGNMSLYVENTNNFTYSKSSTFTTVISGMTNVFSGNMTIPSSPTNSSTIIFTLPAAFNYSGGGLYIAFDWVRSTPAATCGTCGYTWYYTNRSTSNMAAYKNSATNNTLTLSTLSGYTDRPVCVFEAINAATNEAELIMVNSPGTIAESLHDGYKITADVMNKSVNVLTNLSVSLAISGDNSFTDTQVIPTIAPGAIETVTFASFSPSLLGSNAVAVSLPNDQNNQNNDINLEQEVTCNRLGHNPPLPTFTASYGNANFPIMGLARYTFNTSTTLTAVNIAIQVDYTPNATLYGVLMDDSNTILATTNTVNAVPLTISSFQAFTFTSPQPLAPNQDYYIGMCESKGYFLAANEDVVGPLTYFSANGTGGNVTPISFGYFGIEPVLSGPQLLIAQVSTVICSGESIELSVTGASTYTWSASVFNPVEDPYSPAIMVAPTSNEIYNVFGIDDAGCSNTTSTPIAVKACTGLSENSSIQNLKVYPNPALSGRSKLMGLVGENIITIYNMMGEKIFVIKTMYNSVDIDLASYPEGTYMIRVTDQKSDFRTFKLVNQK